MGLWVWLWIVFFGPTVEDKIGIIKDGFLDFRPGTSIGDAFEGYPWWKGTSWKLVANTQEADRIAFTGFFLASEAASAFKKNHQYEFRMSVKYMQLKPVYTIGKEDEEELSFTIEFELHADGTFSVVSGRLGLKHPQTQTWRYVSLSDKATVAVIKAFYHDMDPYSALVKGMPYK